MLSTRDQENLVRSRPIAGKALQPKTPSNFQTPRTTNRAPLGAKTTNAKAQTVLKDKNNAKLQVFKTPAPKAQRVEFEKSKNQTSTARRSGRSKITVAPSRPIDADVLADNLDDDEPDFGYAPPPPVELPDPPMEFNYDQTFPQFQPENMFRGYGEIYLSSPKDENGFSIRLKKEEEEHRKYQEEQEQEYTRRMELELSKPIVLSDDEFNVPKSRNTESKPDTLKARSAAAALSSMRLPAAASKQTASSRLKINKPIQTKAVSKRNDFVEPSHPRPLSVSKNTIGFPKARKPPSIIPESREVTRDDHSDVDTLANELSDFEFSSPDLDDDEDIFQLPMPE